MTLFSQLSTEHFPYQPLKQMEKNDDYNYDTDLEDDDDHGTGICLFLF